MMEQKTRIYRDICGIVEVFSGMYREFRRMMEQKTRIYR